MKHRKKGPIIIFGANIKMSEIKKQADHCFKHVGPWKKSDRNHEWYREGIDGKKYWSFLFMPMLSSEFSTKEKVDAKLLKEGFVLHGKIYAK